MYRPSLTFQKFECMVLNYFMSWLIVIGIMIILAFGFVFIQMLYDKNPEPFDMIIKFLVWIGMIALSIYASFAFISLIFEEKSIFATIIGLLFGIGFGVTAINIFRGYLDF